MAETTDRTQVAGEVDAGLAALAECGRVSTAEACGAHADHHPHCATHSRAATACVEAPESARAS